jgi:hypothetical protein
MKEALDILAWLILLVHGICWATMEPYQNVCAKVLSKKGGEAKLGWIVVAALGLLYGARFAAEDWNTVAGYTIVIPAEIVSLVWMIRHGRKVPFEPPYTRDIQGEPTSASQRVRSVRLILMTLIVAIPLAIWWGDYAGAALLASVALMSLIALAAYLISRQKRSIR